jgi:diguanylate cyclase (GGDEF)-like protein
MGSGEPGDHVAPGAPDALARSPDRASDNATPRPSAGTLDLAAILASIGEVPYEWDIETDALAWGRNAGEILMLGDSDATATGRSFARFLEPDNLITRFDAITQSKHQDDGKGVPYQVEYALQPKPGVRLWVEDAGRWFAGPDGRPARAHGVVRVINERHAHEEQLAYLSRFDDLTGEMNRWRLTEMLAKTLDEAVKIRSTCGFLLLAVDNLTRVNEAYGYTVADEVIGAVAKRLRARLRTGDTLGRFSGNKFGVVLRNCSIEEMAVAAERLLSGVRDDVVQAGSGPIAVTMSAGGVVAPRHARDVQETLERAQEALSTARTKRPGSFLVYRPSVEREALRRENVRATDEIVAALNDRRILLAFEPVVATISRHPIFYESLMRIRGADGALMPADAVIPIAERVGLIRLLDRRVLELVTQELVASPAISLSLNLSPASTGDPDWWASLAAHLRAHSAVAERLIVEITEMAEIRDIDETRGFVTRVKDLGCRIAIDDFGAGYTSFRNLRKLGVDIVKIDGAFVHQLSRSADDRVFVRTMLDLARPLGLTTVAEWVQDEETAAMLREWGCDALQGSLVGRATIERPWAAAPPEQTRTGAA